MSLRGWASKTISSPRGAWTRTDQKSSRAERAFVSENMRYGPLGASTRGGSSNALAVTGAVTAMYHWLTSVAEFYSYGQLSRLLYWVGGTTLKMYDFLSSTTTSMITGVSAAGVKMAEAGGKVYVSLFDTDIMGAAQARIVFPLFESMYESASAKAFAGAPSIAPTASNVGSGVCTMGTHYLGYVIESRSGFRGAPCDLTTSIDLTEESTIRLTVTGTFPADARYLHAIMTSALNWSKWFFVPGAIKAVTPGAGTVTADISISDDNLRLAETADPNFFYLTQDGSGNGPILPSVVVAMGKRMAYFVNNKVYFSDPDDFEIITEDQHVVELPGKRQVSVGFQVRGVNYILGPGWTFGVGDNGDVPATWSVPEQVSGAIGTPAPHGVDVDTSGDYAWVASESGLYHFTGRYEALPISYMNTPEWDRINWAAAYAIYVRDDVVNKRVMVAAPLDDATSPTHILTWDYARGMNPYQVDFSLDSFSAGAFGCIARVQDSATGRTQTWVGPAAAGQIVKMDEDATSDAGASIHSIWESGFLLGAKRVAKQEKFAGMDIEASGVGSFRPRLYEPGREEYHDLEDYELGDPPAESPQLGADILAEDVSVRFEMNEADKKFDLESFRVYHRPWIW